MSDVPNTNNDNASASTDGTQAQGQGQGQPQPQQTQHPQADQQQTGQSQPQPPQQNSAAQPQNDQTPQPPVQQQVGQPQPPQPPQQQNVQQPQVQPQNRPDHGSDQRFPGQDQFEKLWEEAQRKAEQQAKERDSMPLSGGQKAMWLTIGILLDVFSIPLVFIVYIGRNRTQRNEALRWTLIGVCIAIIISMLVYSFVDPELLQQAAMSGFGSSQGSGGSSWTSSNF